MKKTLPFFLHLNKRNRLQKVAVGQLYRAVQAEIWSTGGCWSNDTAKGIDNDPTRVVKPKHFKI